MSKADEMFKELYYAKSGINNYSSEISVTTIDFLATYKEIRIDGHIGVKELQAINEKCKELGWIKE